LYGPVVYRWTTKRGLGEHDAADVVQEVFQSVAEHIGRFQRRPTADSLRGWLWTVTRNKIRDHFRRRQNEPSAAGGTAAHAQLQAAANVPEANDEPPDALTAELAHRALRFLETEFEPSTWKAFWATAVDGRDTADTAAELGLTIGAVYKAKSRVLLRLRRELDGWLE
jgi:RNA polymerase sigma-70 factor (ECF subfamily)